MSLSIKPRLSKARMNAFAIASILAAVFIVGCDDKSKKETKSDQPAGAAAPEVVVRDGSALGEARFKAAKVKSAARLVRLSAAGRAYAKSHPGAAAPTMDDLLKSGALDAEDAVSPITGKRYVVTRHINETEGYSTVVAYEPDVPGGGGNILLIDDSVAWYDAESFPKYIAKIK